MDRRVGGCVGEWMVGCMWKDRWVDGWTGIRGMDALTDGRTDERTNERTNERTKGR